MENYSKKIRENLEMGKELLFKISNSLNGLSKIQTSKKAETKSSTFKPINRQQTFHKPKPKELIEYFEIKDSYNGKILFDRRRNIDDAYKKINNLDCIESYLNRNSSHKTSEIYLKNIINYKKKISLLKEKNPPGKIDEDEFSEILTGKFVKILDTNFIDKFIYSIYNGSVNGLTSYYEELLDKVKKYLESLYVFSAEAKHFEANKSISENLLEKVNITPNKTSDKKMHNKIKKTEQLPYFLHCKDEDGDIKKLFIKGRLTIYSCELGR